MIKSLLTSFGQYLKKCDLGLLAIAIACSVISLVAIRSATLSFGTNQFMIIQLLAVVLGIVAFFVVSAIDLDKFGDLWIYAYIFNILFQLSLYFLGSEGNTGNRSWIRLEDLGIPIPLGIQPGEIGKLIFIFTISRHFYILRDKLDRLASLLQLGFHMLSTVAAVYVISHDLGVALSYVLIFIIMLFASGMSMKIFLPLCAAGCASLVPIWKYFLKGYHKTRILVLFDPMIDYEKARHGIYSMTAVGGGQMFGYGYMQGTMTQYERLPSKHTDFIFSTICEEWGLVGGVVVILILSMLVWKIFHDAYGADNRFGYLMCVGISGMFMVQILINLGMCLGIMPVIGLTLPFISYGGTSVLTMYIALGMVCGLQMRKRPDRLK
ncbi:MAG: rod shape-determining protein RodA [Clostridia bacterium]|nr:rod shape-determining protein RodA [Clostridia bacterium]